MYVCVRVFLLLFNALFIFLPDGGVRAAVTCPVLQPQKKITITIKEKTGSQDTTAKDTQSKINKIKNKK